MKDTDTFTSAIWTTLLMTLIVISIIGVQTKNELKNLNEKLTYIIHHIEDNK